MNKTKLQEVMFDLIDVLNNNDLSDIEIEGFQEFDNLREFLQEQKEKIESLEAE